MIVILFLSKICYSQGGWVQQSTGTSLSLRAISFLDLNYGFAMGQNGRMLKTTNGGANWVILSSITSETIVDVKILSSSRILGMFFEYPSTLKIIKSTNGGNSWQIYKLDSVARTYEPGEMNFYDANFGVVAYKDKVRYTTNAGDSWNISIVNGSVSEFNDVCMVSATTGYGVVHQVIGNTHRAELFKTTNACETWNSTTIRFDHSDNTYDIKFGFSFINAQNAWVCGMMSPGPVGNENYCIKTTNGFVGNTTVSMGGIRYVHDCFFVNSNTGWLIGDYGVYKTSNSGFTFVNQIPQLKANDIEFINETTGWMVADTGKILKTTTGGEPIGIYQISSETPQRYNLSQNYPNPFNPNTNIRFDMFTKSYVELTVFDISGRKVTTLVNENLQAGTYQADWNATNCPSGVYFYRLVTKGFTETKKMVLIK